MPDMLTIDSAPATVREAIEYGNSRIVCPMCDGGSTREACLSVRPVDDGLLTKVSCWRSTCGWYAYVGGENAKLRSKQVKTARPYTKPTIPVQGIALNTLGGRYGLKRRLWDAHGWRMSEHGEELVMPVHDAYGRERGHITRTFTAPKRCYTFKATCQPWLDWWLVNDHAPVVVVEDTLSACRLAGVGLNAVALLGTSMTTEQAREIDKVARCALVYLALDRDAFAKALKLRERHQHVLFITGVVCLTVDIKNMDSDDDIRGLFDGRDKSDSSSAAESRCV